MNREVGKKQHCLHLPDVRSEIFLRKFPRSPSFGTCEKIFQIGHREGGGGVAFVNPGSPGPE